MFHDDHPDTRSGDHPRHPMHRRGHAQVAFHHGGKHPRRGGRWHDPRWARGFGPMGGFGPSARGGGRARRGDVRAAILALLADEPMHGYQVIQELSDRTEGAWRPSPGSIYPTLQMLEDEGLVEAHEQEGKRVFSLTEQGRAEVEARSGPAPWEDASGDADEPRWQLREAFFQLAAAAMQVGTTGTSEQIERAKASLTDARKALYAILSED
jgi:DNA-binding PadR family transcriptional regulator